MTDQKKQLLDAIDELRKKCDNADLHPTALIQSRVNNFVDGIRRAEIELLDYLDEIVLEIDEDEHPKHVQDVVCQCDRIFKMIACTESWFEILH